MNCLKLCLVLLVCSWIGADVGFADAAKTNAAPSASAAPSAAPMGKAAATNVSAAPAVVVATPIQAPVPTPPPAVPVPSAPVGGVPQRSAAPLSHAVTNASVRNIRFQFDGIPYRDVLERFSQMVDKPLVVDTNLEGTVTFVDPQPYNYGEALDTLNLMLSMKGAMLMEDGHYLRLVALKQLPQMPVPILRGMDRSGDIRSGEIVTVVLEVHNLDSKELGEAITSMLSNAGSMAVLSKSRGLIVTDRLANIQRIRSLLAAIDVQAVADRQMKAFTILHASGALVADLINRTFGVATAPKRTQYNPTTKVSEVLPADPNEYVTAVYDDASRTLVLFGPNERIGLAEELISKFEDKEGGAGDVRIYYPQLLKATDLADMIRQAVPGVAAAGDTAASAATKARLIADAAQNRLVVAGPLAAQIDEIERLINKLDKPIHGTGNSAAQGYAGVRSQVIQITKVFRVRIGESTNVAMILTNALVHRLPNGMVLPAATVTVEPNSQSVVVTGSPGDVQTAVDIVTQLETGSTSPRPQQTRFLEVGTMADAKRLVPLVEQIYRSQVTDSLGGEAPYAKIMADTEAGRLIVTAGEEHLKRIEEIVKQLKTEKPAGVQRTLQIVTLKNVRAEGVFSTLQSLMSERMAERRFEDMPKPQVVNDLPNNRLLVTATEDQFKEITQIIQTLDVAPDKAKRDRRLQAIPLTYLRVDTGLTSIQNLVTERMNDVRFADQPKPLLLPDAANNRLLVTANEEQIKEIQALVASQDVAAPKLDREMAVVPAQSKTAAELIGLTTQLMGQVIEEQANPQLAPKLVPDPTGRQIIVLATAKDLARLTNFIRQLDVSSTAAARQFKGVELFSRNATDLTPLVQQLYQEQLKGGMEPSGGPATLLAEARQNRIMVSGSEKEIARVEAIIRQLDPAEAKAAKEETRVIRLKVGLAQDLSALVEKSLGAQATKVKVLVDQRSNSLVVSGDASAVAAAAEIISQLDTRSDVSPRELRMFELKQGDAAVTTPLINSLFAEMMKDQRGPDYVIQTKIIPDAAGNRLIVTGPKEELRVLAVVVEQLDQAPEGAGGARVFKLNNADAVKVMGVVSNAMLKFDARNNPLRRISVSADRESNSVVVSGTRQDLQDAASIIERLDNEGFDGGPGTGSGTGPGNRGRELKIMDVKSEDPDALATLATKVFSAQYAGRAVTNLVSITPEPSGKRLIVLAPASVLPQIETVITTLDAKDGGLRELTTIELKNGVPADLLPTIQRIYAEQNLGKTTKPATIYPDASGVRLLVYGTKEQASAVKQIAATLEDPQRAPRISKTFDLGRLAEAQRVMPLAQQMYRDQVTGNPKLGPADAQIVSDSKTGRLFVSARDEQIKILEDIIGRLQISGATNVAARETRAIEVGSAADVQRLQPLVQGLYQDQWKDKQETDPADAQIMPDTKAGRLIITGKPEHVRAIEAIVRQFSDGKSQTDTRETRLYDLTTANAAELVVTVRSLYLDTARARLGNIQPDTLILPDAIANRLIVVGDSNELAAVEDIIKKLDKVGAQSAGVRVFKLKSADPTQVSQILSTALVRYDAYGRPQKRVAVVADVQSRTLIATGDPKEIQGLSVIIEQLDSAGAQPERKMKVVQLKTGSAVETSTKLRQLFTDQLKTQPDLGTTDILIMVEAPSNQLILAGNEAQLGLLEKILGELQAAQANVAPRATKMVDFIQADEVNRLLPMIQQLFQERWRDQAPGDPADATFLSDLRNARLIITARTNQLATIETIIAELRGNQKPAERDTRVFDLTTASAIELATTVRTLYQEQAKSRPGAQTADTAIIPDGGANRLILTGPTNELNLIEDIVKKLDKIGSQSASVRVFKLKSADPDQVTQILSTALIRYDAYGRVQKRVSVVADPKSRTLIATGDPKELQGLSVIVEQLDTAGAQPERKMRVLPLKTLKASALVTKVKQLYLDQVKSQPELGVSEILIMDEPVGNQLILAGSEEQLKLLEQILKQLQDAAVTQGPRETKVFEVGASEEVTRLLPLVQQLYQDEWKSKEAGDQADAQILSDEKNGRLVVTGKPEHLKEIESILGKIASPLTNTVGRETRVYELNSTSATELSATVKTIYEEQLKTRSVAPATRAIVLPDAASNRLVVSGPTNELAVMDEIVQKLDKVDAKTGGRTRIFKLKTVDAEQVSTILSTALATVSPYASYGGRNTPRITSGVDKANNILIVSGDPKDLQAAAVIVEQMDAILSREPRSMRILTLKQGLPSEVASRVTQLYKDQVKGQLKGAIADALILGEDVGNRLIVAASESHMKLIEDIVQQLQQAPDTTARQTRVVMLQRNSASSVATMISQLYTRETVSEDPGQRLVVTPSADDRTLVLDANQPMLEKVEQLVKSLDGEQAQEKFQVRTYQIPDGNAADLAESLGRLFSEKVGKQSAGLDPRFESDPSANVLLVAATKEQFVTIDKLIEDLKKTAEVANEIRTFKLQHGDPLQVAEVLEAMLTEPSGPRAGQPLGARSATRPANRTLRPPGAARGPNAPRTGRTGRGFARPGLPMQPSTDLGEVRVAPATSLNAVVVQGPPEKLALAEKLIESLDKEEIDGRSVIQTVHLKKARADALAEAVAKTIEGNPGQGRLKRVAVTSVDGANSLLINGPSDAVEEVMKIVRELDTEESVDEIEVRIYKLENGNLKEISVIVRQLLNNVTAQLSRGKTQRSMQATVTEDERSHSLVISATKSHFKVVEKLLSTLDKVPERSDRDVHFVWLKKARAEDVVPKVQAIFEGRAGGDKPVIEADTTANSITVIARHGDLVQIQDLIGRLDEAAKDSSVVVRFRPLERTPAEQMAQMLTNIYPQMTSGRIRLVEKVPPPPKQDKAVNLTISPPTNALAQATNVAAAENITRPTPEVVIAVDKQANALLLSGPAAELDQIDRIITDLSASFFGNDAELRVFPLKEADPVIIARTLNDLFRPEQVRVEAPIHRPGEIHTVTPAPKVTVVSEPRTRAVIVRAKPTDLPLMEALIKQLDATGVSAELEFRLVRVTNAPPEKIIPLVTQMVHQLSLIRPGEPLTVTPDARSKSILIVARSNTLAQVEQAIRSLDSPSAYIEAEVMVVPLKKAAAPQLAAVLQNMLKPNAVGELTPEARELQEQVKRLRILGEGGQAVSLDLTKPIKILADPVAGAAGGNRLVLTSTADNLKALAEVVRMMDSVSVTEGVSVRIVRLEHADAASAAQTLTTIFLQGQRFGQGPSLGKAEPDSPQGKGLTSPLNVSADARCNALVLSGRQDSIELALKIIDDLDQQTDRFVTEIKLFRLKHASATRLVPLLQATFMEGPAVPGLEGLNAYVTRLRIAGAGKEKPKETDQPKTRAALTIQADDLSNILIVAARSDKLPLIEEVITQLDIPEASGMATIRVYPLLHADAVVIQKILTDLYAGSKAQQVRNEDKPTLTVDERGNALIVSGNEKAFAIIDALMAKLDRELPPEFRNIRIVALEHADCALLAATIQRLMDARVLQRSTLSKSQADALRVMVMGDDRSNSLLVAGSKDGYELVEQLARQLDQAESALSGKIRLVPLKYADARTLTLSLTTLFTQRYAAARTPEMQRKRPVLVADAAMNAILVSAGLDDNAAVDELVAKLDRPLEDPTMTVAVLPLTHNDATKVATMLTSVFLAKQKNRTVQSVGVRPTDAVDIVPESLNNSLMIYCSKENLEVIKGLLEKLDVEPTVAEGIIELFTLEYTDAQRVATMLQTLVQQGLYRPGRPEGLARNGGSATQRDALAITVDPRSNTLIVSASPENLAVVREIIKKTDTKDFAENGNIKLYTLKHARASTLGTVLDQFFRAKRTAESVAINAALRSIPITVTPDDRSNTLLVAGGKESLEAAERLITQLDSEDALARMNFRVFPLKRGTAITLQATLKQLFANRPARIKGEPPEPISVVADAWANALIVGASVDDMGMVESLLDRLDGEPADVGLAVQVLPLAKADSRRVAQTVQALYREGTPGLSLPVNVNPDERLNAIVISAGENDLKRISELVKKLDTDQVGRVSEIRVIQLRYARAENLSTTLNQALNTKPVALTELSPNTQSLLQFITRTDDGKQLVTSALKEAVLITPDSRMNSLIISAPVDYMGLLEQIITRLDTASPRQAKIKVFSLQNASARQTALLLTSLFRLQPVGGVASQRSIQYTLVKPVTEPESGVEGEEEMASAVLGSEEQSALTVTVDPRTNCLLVGGTEQYVTLVSQIIDTLDSSTALERKTEVYRMKNSQAKDVATALGSFLDQERQKITQSLGTEAVDTAQRMLEHQVAIMAEPVNNALLISASPRYFEEIKSLIIELDQPQAQVLIQVIVAEVTLDSERDLGIEWSYTKDIGGGNTLGTGTDFGVQAAKAAAGGYYGMLQGNNFNFLLRALQNDGRLEVLSRPQILTGDNKAASISIGQKYPMITGSQITPQGGTINQFQYEDVGVNLTVTPRISPDGTVKMEVGTTNSEVTSTAIQINNNATVYAINQRKATTTVSVHSGQTVLIGGLIGTQDDTRTKKIPFFGDIPYLGPLFRSTSKSSTRKELLIVLTPQILTSAPMSVRTNDIYKITRQELDQSDIKEQIQRDQLQNRVLDQLYPDKPKTNAVPEEKRKIKRSAI